MFLTPFGEKMNKNFKVIFNRARGSHIVASECAKSAGKSKSVVTTSSIVVAGLVSLSFMNPLLATEGTNNNNLIGGGYS